MNYYNEIDKNAAAMLKALISAQLIPNGEVDDRSIEDVKPGDLRGYRQCHFFAGIGGWPYALALAGWPADRPVWTGSCPCQPFSAAGKGAGFEDQRHLWPAWFHLIRECRPAAVFGEQVASKAADPWIDLVHADLEGVGYTFGCVSFPAAGVGAPHIRDRNYWVSYSDRRAGGQGRADVRGWADGSDALPWAGPCGGGVLDGVADADGRERAGFADGEGRQPDGTQTGWFKGDCIVTAGGELCERPGPTNGFWRDADWLGCRDGKWRPVEPGTFPLAHGLPARVGRLRGYGNAIVPQAAAEFVIAAEMAIEDMRQMRFQEAA